MKVEITATHPHFGAVTFAIEASDAKAAFQIWKQIVFSSRQWVVRKNTGHDQIPPVAAPPSEFTDCGGDIDAIG